MPPSFATYQQAAQSIYEPQKTAEAASLTTQKQGAINTEEAAKGQISTDYQTAIDSLNETIKQNVGKINQLYTERLGGNFSGLQGNDLGGMFAAAGKQQSTIEQTRANKLNDIAVSEANISNQYSTDISNLGSKYQGLESQYANENYNSAVKDYNTQQLEAQKEANTNAYRQAQLNLGYARLGASNSKASQPSQGQIKQADMGTIATALQGKAGKDGHVSQQTWNAAMSQWLAAGYSAKDFVNSNMQFINQRYGGYHGYN